MEWKNEILKCEYEDGNLQFFNPSQIVDILFTVDNIQITTTTRETFGFPLDLNKDNVEKFLSK